MCKLVIIECETAKGGERLCEEIGVPEFDYYYYYYYYYHHHHHHQQHHHYHNFVFSAI
jgi:hypothetical protein